MRCGTRGCKLGWCARGRMVMGVDGAWLQSWSGEQSHLHAIALALVLTLAVLLAVALVVVGNRRPIRTLGHDHKRKQRRESAWKRQEMARSVDDEESQSDGVRRKTKSGTSEREEKRVEKGHGQKATTHFIFILFLYLTFTDYVPCGGIFVRHVAQVWIG